MRKFENIEPDVFKMVPPGMIVPSTDKQDFYEHVDAIWVQTGRTIDIKQATNFGSPSVLTWPITVVTDNGSPGAIFSDKLEFIGVTNMYRTYKDTDYRKPAPTWDNKPPMLKLLAKEQITNGLLSYGTIE